MQKLQFHYYIREKLQLVRERIQAWGMLGWSQNMLKLRGNTIRYQSKKALLRSFNFSSMMCSLFAAICLTDVTYIKKKKTVYQRIVEREHFNGK
jgi:hypothetical protein